MYDSISRDQRNVPMMILSAEVMMISDLLGGKGTKVENLYLLD